MSDATVAVPLTLPERIDQIFPTLTAAQIARIATHGRKRRLEPGEVLQEVGAPVRFFLVTAGKIDILSVLGPNESLVATLQAGQFTGEANLLSGLRGLTRIRASEAGEVIGGEAYDSRRPLPVDATSSLSARPILPIRCASRNF